MKKMDLKLWRYIRYYRFNSILLRNFILIMTLIIIPLVGISVYVYSHNDANMRGEIERSASNELARTRDTVDMILAETERFSVRIKSDPDVMLFLSQRHSSPLAYEDAQRILRIEQILQMAEMTSPYIDSIFIYSELNDFLLTVGSRINSQNPYYKWWPVMYAEQPKSPHFWITGEEPESKQRTLSFVNRRVSYNEKPENNGVVSINMDITALGGMIDGDITERSIYILNSQGNIVYNRAIEKLNRTLEETDPELSRLLARGFDSTIVELNDQNYVISFMPSSALNGWSYLSVVSLQLYQPERSRMVELMVVLLLVSICTSILLAFIIAVKGYSPIRQIMSLIENKENPFIMLTKSPGPPKQWNETGYILSNLTASFHQSHNIEAELQEKYELLRKAQAVALQAQINPHFLYNTLESINWKVMRLTNGKNEASQMLLSLSALLRLPLETEEDQVPIGKEMEHVKLYMEMQKLRYKDKISFNFVVEEKLLDCKIVKLVLQPLVENAIYYGIKQSGHNGTITIRVFARGSSIVVRVRDNGVGIPPQMVFELNDSFKHNHLQENKHIGLRNVNQRLRLAFGEQYGLSIRSKLGAGTIVEMTLPVLNEAPGTL